MYCNPTIKRTNYTRNLSVTSNSSEISNVSLWITISLPHRLNFVKIHRCIVNRNQLKRILAYPLTAARFLINC